MESLIERLRALAEAYPEDVFPALTKEQTNAHPEIVTRASASMGRHFSAVFTQAADEIERLRQDAERYRWLRKQGNREKAADMTLHRMNLDAAIDAEMAGANTRVDPKSGV